MLTFAVVNGNDTGERLSWAVAAPQPSWLSISEAGDMVTVTADRTGLQPGDYTDMVFVTSNGGNWPVPVSMRVPGGGGGGCAAFPVLPGGPLDPTHTALLGLLLTYLIFAQRPTTTPWRAA